MPNSSQYLPKLAEVNSPPRSVPSTRSHIRPYRRVQAPTAHALDRNEKQACLIRLTQAHNVSLEKPRDEVDNVGQLAVLTLKSRRQLSLIIAPPRREMQAHDGGVGESVSEPA